MTKSTSPPQTTVATLIDEGWESTRARKRSASRRLLEALEHAVEAQDVDAVVTVRVAANQMRYSSPDVPQTVFAEVLEQAEHWQEELEAAGLRPADPRRLDVRLDSLLLLLRRSPDGSVSSSDALAAFVVTGKNGDEAFDFRGPYGQWRHLLERGYERAYRIYGDLTRTALGAVHVQIERQVKSVAVELITAGAQVRGLGSDAVPLIAFCLLHREIPIGMDTAD